MTPRERYARDLERADFREDPAQAAAVARLDALYARLLEPAPAPGFAGRLRSALGRPARREPVRGLYMWGGVGRGKTYLMDLFF